MIERTFSEKYFLQKKKKKKSSDAIHFMAAQLTSLRIHFISQRLNAHKNHSNVLTHTRISFLKIVKLLTLDLIVHWCRYYSTRNLELANMPVSKVCFASNHSSWCGGSRERLLVVSILAFVQNEEILITSIIVKLDIV